MRTSALHVGMMRGKEVNRHDFNYALTTAPATEPVSLAEAKLFSRIDTTADDALVTALIIAARQSVEKQTGRSLITQTWTAKLDQLPSATTFNLSYRPIASITSIKAYNEDGTSDAITVPDNIILDGDNGRVSLLSSAESITGDRLSDVYEIVYVAGYGAATAVPEWAKLAIKQMVSHWYEHREAAENGVAVIPLGAQLLIDQNKALSL